MSTDQKKFIRTILIIVITAVTAQIIVGFGILNRDHFTIKTNNEKIIEVLAEQKTKMSHDAFNQYIKFKEDEVKLLRELINEYKNNSKENIEGLEAEIKENSNRIDKLFIEFGIGTVRGNDFEVDVIPEIFKEGN